MFTSMGLFLIQNPIVVIPAAKPLHICCVSRLEHSARLSCPSKRESILKARSNTYTLDTHPEGSTQWHLSPELLGA